MLTKWPHRLTAAAVLIVASTAIGQEPVFIGLVREDGYLIPIATVTPKLFESPFRAETTVNDEPLSPKEPAETERPFRNLEWRLYGRGTNGIPVMPPARSLPPPTAAALAMRAAEIKTEIRTIEPLTVDSHCSDQAVWRTTLPLPPAPENVAPARAKVVVRLAQLRRHSMAGVATYYFEAHKAWGPALDGGLVTGWIVATPSGLRDHDVTYKFNDDGFKENDSAIVWGVIRHQGRTLWILEWHGYEWEYYTIHDWPSGVKRLTVEGGGC